MQRAGQGIDQGVAVRGAPTRAQVIAGHAGKIGGTGGPEVVAGGGVMEGGRVTRPIAKGVEGRIEKADGGPSGGYCLLVDQCGEAGPQWCRATGAAESAGSGNGRSDTGVVIGNIYIISGEGHIGHVAHGGGALVGGHAGAGLPARNGIVGAGAAAAADTAAPVPDLFRNVRTARSGGC